MFLPTIASLARTCKQDLLLATLNGKLRGARNLLFRLTQPIGMPGAFGPGRGGGSEGGVVLPSMR